MANSVPVVVAFGSNLGDSLGLMTAALNELQNHPQIELMACSRWYRTAAIGPPQPDYLNGCVLLHTTLEPLNLFSYLQTLEHQAQRQRLELWGPRTLDLDIILFADLILATPRLTIPHPRFRQRAFVLVPLAEIYPEGIDPVTGHTIASLLSQISTAGVWPWSVADVPETRPGVDPDTAPPGFPQSPQADESWQDSWVD